MVLGLSSRHGDLVCICSVVIEDDYRSCLEERARSCSETCSMGIVSVRYRSNGNGSRTTKVEWRENLSIEEIVIELDVGHWLGQGLAVALNGERCPVDVHCQRGDEVALLPPVSGG